MQFQNDSDILQVKRRSGGGLIAVGVPLDAGLCIQEYWSEGRPHYAIANVSTDEATVAIVEWNREPGQRLLGPWTIAPKTVQQYDLQSVREGYAGSLVGVSLNETPVYGLLKSPQPPPEPIDWNRLGGILTIYGLNGIGDRHSNLQFVQEKLTFDSEQAIELTLKIRADAGIVSFKNAADNKRLPQAVVTDAASATLSVERQDDSYVIGRDQTSVTDFHEISLSVMLPVVDAETMAALWGHVAGPGGAGFAFGRGLIVRPGG